MAACRVECAALVRAPHFGQQVSVPQHSFMKLQPVLQAVQPSVSHAEYALKHAGPALHRAAVGANFTGSSAARSLTAPAAEWVAAKRKEVSHGCVAAALSAAICTAVWSASCCTGSQSYCGSHGTWVFSASPQMLECRASEPGCIDQQPLLLPAILLTSVGPHINLHQAATLPPCAPLLQSALAFKLHQLPSPPAHAYLLQQAHTPSLGSLIHHLAAHPWCRQAPLHLHGSLNCAPFPALGRPGMCCCATVHGARCRRRPSADSLCDADGHFLTCRSRP